MDADPDSLEARLRILGVRESHSDAICNWHNKQLQDTEQLQEIKQLQGIKQLQARDRSLPGPTCTLDSRPGRQTPG